MQVNVDSRDPNVVINTQTKSEVTWGEVYKISRINLILQT